MKLADLVNLPWNTIDTAPAPVHYPQVMDVAELQHWQLHPAKKRVDTRDQREIWDLTSIPDTPYDRMFFNLYEEDYRLRWHQDKSYFHLCIIGVAGTGQLWMHQGKPELFHQEHLTVPPSAIPYRMYPGDLTVWTLDSQLRGEWFHGGPTGARVSCVVRF